MDIPIQPVSTPTEQNSVAAVSLSQPAPVSNAERIRTVDMIRGVALLGILLMNIPGFGIDFSSMLTIGSGPHNTADYYTLHYMEALFEGTMRGLFSMLFGAGMILFTTNKKELPGGATVAEYYYRRLLWLVLFGVFNAYVLLWRGDILFFYGLMGMLLFAFRKSSPKTLLILGFICIAVNIGKNQISYAETREKRALYKEAIAAEKAKKPLTDEQKEARGWWEGFEKNFQPNPERIEENVSKMRGDYGTVFSYYLPINAQGEIWYTYEGCWDMLSMMFIGMALLGLGFFSNDLRGSTYLMGLLLGYGVGIPLGIYFAHSGVDFRAHPAAAIDHFRVPFYSLYDIRRVFLCLGHASLIILVYRSKVVPWLMHALACVGQMAFTNYLMQSIICSLFFYGYGLGNYNKLAFHELYYVVASVWIFQLIASPIWLKYFRFGPFEWLWRSLTYWKMQPMKKAVAA